jgi:hypothetical protein
LRERYENGLFCRIEVVCICVERHVECGLADIDARRGFADRLPCKWLGNNRDCVCAPCDVVNVIGDRSTRRFAQTPFPFLARLETRVEDAALLQ